MDYMIGRCRFCGSERDVLADDQERADEMVSKECACGQWDSVMKSKKKILHNGYKDKPQRRCWYTGAPGAERHEVFNGPNRQTSIELGFQVDVCPEIHARLHASADPWAKVENKKWRMYFQAKHEEELIASGLTAEEARAE